MKATLIIEKFLLPNLREIKLFFKKKNLLIPPAKTSTNRPLSKSLGVGHRYALHLSVWKTTDGAVSELGKTLCLLPVILYTPVRQSASITAQQHKVLTYGFSTL